MFKRSMMMVVLVMFMTLLMLIIFIIIKIKNVYFYHKQTMTLSYMLGRHVDKNTDKYLLHRSDPYALNYGMRIREFINFYAKNKKLPYTLVSVGLIRNHGKEITKYFRRFWIPMLSTYFQSYSIVLLESHSSDDTPFHLKQLETDFPNNITILSPSHESPFKPVSYHFNKTSSSERTNTMANLRNQLLNYLYNHNSQYDIFQPSTLVLMMDPDLIGTMHHDSFLHGVYTLINNPKFVAVGCNTITPDERIFDTFPFIPLMDSYAWISEKDKNLHDKSIQTRYGKEMVWNRSMPLTMLSTFNGMVLYSFFRLSVKYPFPIYYPLLENDENWSVCEHTRFHLQFPHGSIALDPLWIFVLEKNLF